MQPLTKSSVIYLVRPNEIFLFTKAATPKAIKRKINGKLLGYGGDLKEGESIYECGARELYEESGFVCEPSDLKLMAKVRIDDEKGPRLTLYYFLLDRWTGVAKESREVLNPQWYSSDPLPENILAADKLVLPRILIGEKLEGWIEYNSECTMIMNVNLSAVENLHE